MVLSGANPVPALLAATYGSHAMAEHETRRPRIVLCVAGLGAGAGGPSRSVPALADHLIRMGMAVTVLTSGCGDSAEVLPNNHAVTISRAPRKQFWGFAANIFDTCGTADLVHDNGLWLPFNHRVARWSRVRGIPRIVSPRGMLEPWALRHKAWKKRAAWQLYQRRDLQTATVVHVTAVQELEAARAVGLMQPVAVIPNGVELPPHRPRAPRSDDRRVALFLSRIHPKKGLLNLVQAWGVVRPEGWRLLIAGPDEGGHRRVVEEAVRHAGLQDVIEFCGPVYGEAKDTLFAQADLFALPTFSENFGIAVAEALAWSVPVITTWGAPWAGLVDDRCGWWVEIGAEPLVAALAQATGLSDLERREMGQRGRALVERCFTWPGAAEQMLSVYRWVLGEGSRPHCVSEC